MKDHEHQSLLLSKLVLNVPYDASVVDPVFASYVRENALTCIVTGKWQQAAPLALKSHGAESGGRNPFARALKSHGEGSEGSVAYYCSRSTRSFGLTAARLKSGENAKIAKKRLPGEQPDGNYTETKRLHILRVTWQEGFVLDLREIGVNPYSRQVSFTLKNSAPLSGGCFPQKQLKKAVHDVVAAERLARNELGNPQHPWEQYVAGQKKLEPSQKLLETRGGSGGGGSVEQGNGNRDKGAGVAFQLDEPFDEQNPLEPHQMRGMSFPERETLSLDFYIFKPSEKQTVLGATGVSGEVIYHFNQIVDIEKWAASTKRRIVDEIPGVSVPSSGTASDERCIHRTVRVAEAQAARWQGRKHLQPFCELEFESVDAAYGSVVESPRKKRARKISALADVSAGGGGAGDPDPTSAATEVAPAKRKREELVERSKKAGSAADTARLQQSARSSQNGTHKCYNLAWTLGRPKGLGFHFANSKAFQKMKFWDLVRMKTIQKTALLGQKRKTRRRDGAAEAKPRNKSLSRAGKRKRRSKSAELPDEGSIPASPRRMRELRDAAFVNQLKYEHVYSNNDVFQSAEDVKKYYYRAGYNNHLLNPTWFSAFQKSDWREREFYVKTAAVEDLDVLSDESEADSVFDRDSALDELEHEERELDTLSEEDEQLPPPYVSRLERAKNSVRDYLKPFFWWAVYRALDMEAARIAVKSCVETVRDVIVEEENSSIATAVLDDLARSITRKVVELEHGTLADRVIQHSVNNAAATEDVQTAIGVDSLLDSVYGNSLRRMKNEHIVIARRTLNRVYATVVEQWKALVLTEQEKQGRGSSEGGSEADAVLHASTWGQNRGDADSIYSVDTADHHSIAVCELGYKGPYAIGCEGIRVIEHFTDFHASGEDGGDEKEQQTKNGKDEFDADYDVQRERKQARRERRQQIAEETEMRKQVMRDARKFRRELKKRLEFLGDAHGLELRGFEHDIFNSEFGVANPQNERRGPSVKELVVAEARARRSGMVNYPADDEAEHRKFAPRERSATAERDRSRSAVPRPAEEGKAKAGDQAKPKPRSVRIATTLAEDTGKSTGKAEQQQHQQYAGFVHHVYNDNVLQKEQQSARRRNKLAASQLNSAQQMDIVSAFDLEQRKHKLLRTRAAPGAAAAVLDEMGKSEAELVSGGAVRVRKKEDTRSRGRTRRSSTGAELITAAEMITGGSSSSGTKLGGGIQRENPVARDETEFFVLRACSSRLRKTAVECEAVVGESGAAQQQKKTGRVSERKSADGYYKDRETYTWEQPPPPPDVFTRERDQVLASYTNTARKDKTSRAGLRKSTLDELELLQY